MVHFARWKTFLILAVCVLGVVYAIPNFLGARDDDGSLPSWIPHKQISLGLDLRGGSHLLLEVEVAAVLRERMEALIDSMRVALRNARIGYRDLGGDATLAQVTIVDSVQAEAATALLAKLDSDVVVERDGPRFSLRLSEQAVRARKVAAVEQSIEIVRRRVDETGVREPTIQRQGEDRILLQLPGVDDPERLKSLLGKTAKMTFHLLDPRVTGDASMAGRTPPGTQLMPSVETGPDGKPRTYYIVQKRVMVSGDTLVDAQPSFDNRTNEPVVSFRFDTSGGRRFGEVTRDNVGKPFAIVLDGKVISAPVIREPILGGSGQISGNFTVAAARDLSLLLRAGALPAPLTILEERTVGPGLGADSIAAGKLASIVGMVLVVVCMVVVYGFFGLLADLALAVNLLLIVGLLSVLQATLTLPGIAGIALTIGMAVDANVLVFERIREEVRNGRTPISAIEAGYKGAITTIVDSNLTTLIAALLLYQFGSGPVRGFAVTLSIGIATSMFTAVMLTRLMVATWLRRRRPQALPI